MITYVRQDIKDCPFCGCKGVVKSYTNSIGERVPKRLYYVECSGCHVHQAIDKACEAREKAVDAWNRRMK